MASLANTSDYVKYAQYDAVAHLTLAQPTRRNALSMDMMAALLAHVRDIAQNPSIRAVVLDAEGPAFCAGHDLKEMSAARDQHDGGKSYFNQVFQRCTALMTQITRSPQIYIAAVDKMATAAGCQLVATCDLALAGADATFCTPGVNIGLFCSTPMVALARNVTRKKALEMLVTGQVIDAELAESWGLINRLVAAGDASQAALTWAHEIAKKSGKTLRIGKEAFYHQLALPLDDAYTYTGQVMVENMLTKDAEEGISAFIEKRTPQWQND